MAQDTAHWMKSAAEIAAEVRTGRLSASAVMESVLARIADVDGKVNAYAMVDPDQARRGAAAVDEAVARGEDPGPLAGVPFSVKDLVETAGMETAFGSHVFAGNVPDKDAVAVARLRQAGAILIGKTNTPEFGIKALTNNPRHGYTRNPWDLERSPGGSSGGATAAVAAGMGPLGMTTDGAGSSRIPAAVCGVLGLKPTLGRVANETAIELFSTFVNLGLATRTVADMAAGLTAMSGPDDGDPWSIGRARAVFAVPENPFRALRGLKVLVFRRMGNRLVDHGVEALLDARLALLKAEGAEISEGPDDFDWSKASQLTAMRAYQRARLGWLLEAHEDVIDPVLTAALKEAAHQDLAAVQAAPSQRSGLFRRVQALFEPHDVIVTPTVSAPPPHFRHTQDDPITINNELAGPLRANWYGYTGTFNHTGHPAMSIPMGYTHDGLPAGMQVVGRWFDEQRLIDIAAACEARHPWVDEWPTL